MSIFRRAFLLDAAERAVVTFAEVLPATWVVGQAGLLDVDWVASLSVAGLAAVASLCKSLVAVRVGDDTASLVDTNH